MEDATDRSDEASPDGVEIFKASVKASATLAGTMRLARSPRWIAGSGAGCVRAASSTRAEAGWARTTLEVAAAPSSPTTPTVPATNGAACDVDENVVLVSITEECGDGAIWFRLIVLQFSRSITADSPVCSVGVRLRGGGNGGAGRGRRRMTPPPDVRA